MSHTIAPVLGEATVQELREAVRGEVVTAGDDGYAEASRIWNGAHDGRTLSGQDIDRLVRICIDSHIGLDQSGWSRSGPAGGRGGPYGN